MNPLKKLFNTSKFLKISLILFLAALLTIFSIKVVQAAVDWITAEKTVLLVDDVDENGITSPGDILEYTVTIQNTSDTNATGVMFNDTLDSNTTLVTNSIIHSPIAVPEVYPYPVLGNVGINSSWIGYSVLRNDNLGQPAITEITLDSPTSANGGNVTMVTSGYDMGRFTYDPPPGYEGPDTFTYTLTNSAGSSTATVSFTVSNMIWFINNNAETCTTLADGCGRLSKPFSTLTSFAALNNGSGNNPAANDVIFVYESNTKYSGAITLLEGQKLIGQDSSTSLSNLTLITPSYSSQQLPVMASSNSVYTTLGDTVTLNSKTTVRGLKINTSNSTGMADPVAHIDNVAVSEVSIISNNGKAVDFSYTAGVFNFDNITVTNGTNGIVLDTFIGSFTLPAGQISNTSYDAIKLNEASDVTISNISIYSAAGSSNNPACNFTSISTACEAAIEIFNSNNVSLSNIVISQGNNGMQGIVAHNTENLTIKNSQLFNVGNTDNESGILMGNMKGALLFEDLNISSPAEFGIRIYQTTGDLAGTFRRVKIQNNNGVYGEDGLSIRVEGGKSTILVDDSDFLNTGGSGVAASVQGSLAVLNLTLQNSTWSENHQLPHAVSFTTDGGGVGNITIQNNTMSGCATPGNCFGAIDLDASDNSFLSAIISGNTLSNIGDGTGIEFIVNDNANGEAIINNNTLNMQSNRIGMNFLARSVNMDQSLGRLDITLSENTINGISSYPENLFTGMNFQSGSSSGTHAQTLCVNLSSPAGGNIINGSLAYAYELQQRTGTNFLLQGLDVPGTNELNVENFVKTNNPNGTLSGSTDVIPAGYTTIVNYTAGVCDTPVDTPLPPTDSDELDAKSSLDVKSESDDNSLTITDFNNPPLSQTLEDSPPPLMTTKVVTDNQIPEISLGVLPPGASVVIQYQVTVNDPISPTNASQVVNQGVVSGSNFENVLTDDPTITGLADPTVMLLPKPDLTATKTNNVSGLVTLPDPWNWNIRLENIGNYQAEFSAGNTLITDQLPDTGLTYANLTISPETMSEKIDCAISSNNLSCVALTDLVFAAAETFDVSFDVTPLTAGVHTNPINAGICKADPDGLLVELDFENNVCSDTVRVDTAPTITSADSVEFLYNTPNSFSVETSPGYPTTTMVSVSGTLPTGMNTIYFADGSAEITGTPTTSGRFNLTITANNTYGLETTQDFTLIVNRPPEFTSASETSFTTGAAGSFNITTIGYPSSAITFISEPALPDGLTLDDNGDGTATLSGTAATGDGGIYTISLSAKNGILPDATQTLTLTIGQQPAITNANTTNFTVGTPGSFTFTSSGYPDPTFTFIGSLPSGVSFIDNKDGTASLSGTPVKGSGGQYSLVITAANSFLPDASQNFSLTVKEPPVFTCGANASFTTTAAGSFSITTAGYPYSTITYTSDPALPASLIFSDNGYGNASLSGSPITGDGGEYTLTLTASNGVSPNASQTLKVFIDDGPAITSANNTTFEVRSIGSFKIFASGYPHSSFSYTGSLPEGVSLKDNLDGTASLSGIPAAESGGQYSLVISAANGILPNATQNFTLIVNEAPAFTNDSSVSFNTGIAGTFTITTTGYPTSAITYTSDPALPVSLTLSDNGDGTGTLSGTPALGDGGIYELTLTGSNGVNPNATQTLSLTIGQQTAITSTNSATFEVGTSGLFTFTTSGYPDSSISFTGILPDGLSFIDNLNGTATLSGTPTDGFGGVYLLKITSDNGIAPKAEQSFTLTVNEAPEFTNTDHVIFNVDTAGVFTISSNGYPIASITHTSVPDLPTSITLVDNTDGTATLSGTPLIGDGGVYTISLSADNGIDPEAIQTFTLTIGESPEITSVDQVTFVEGNKGSFTITTNGTPTSSITYRGDLPDGVTLVDQKDGTAILSGTPAVNSARIYLISLTASNGVGVEVTQEFSLIVQSAAKILTVNSVEDSGDGILDENEHTNVAITHLLINFSQAMDAQSVIDPTNYSLVKDDVIITINAIGYDALEKIASLSLNDGAALTDGEYQLNVSEKILDDHGYPIGEKFELTFIVDTMAIEIIPFGFNLEDGTILKEDIKLTHAIQTFEITFSEDAANPAGDDDPDDVTNPENYLLVQVGENGKFDTTSCDVGLMSDDIQMPVGPIVYDNNNGEGPFKARLTLNENKQLPNGRYRLFICGSTSITDLAGNKLNGGSDQFLSFSVQVLNAVESLPSTGFTPGKLTNLASQPFQKSYQSLGNLWLELPIQGIEAPITGVPWEGKEWDLTWLNQQVGWLQGTAFPTWNGNTVLTAHAYRPDGLPGPFAYLKYLKYDDTIIIHSQGLKYIYAVRSQTIVSPGNTTLLSKSEKNDWITLITCHQYDDQSQTYLYRTIVRAVLIKVEEDI